MVLDHRQASHKPSAVADKQIICAFAESLELGPKLLELSPAVVAVVDRHLTSPLFHLMTDAWRASSGTAPDYCARSHTYGSCGCVPEAREFVALTLPRNRLFRDSNIRLPSIALPYQPLSSGCNNTCSKCAWWFRSHAPFAHQRLVPEQSPNEALTSPSPLDYDKQDASQSR
jgi:hypothetical protein